MMIVTGGTTDVTTYFALRLAADGTAATGLTITGIDLQYTRNGAAPSTKVDATALAATDSAHGDNQAIQVDATDQPGLYRVDWPDAAFAAGVSEVILTVKVATAFTEHLRVLIDVDVNNTATLTGHTAQTADHTAGIADIPTVAEFNARTIVAASYFDPAVDTVANVTAVATLTGHTAQTADHTAGIAAVLVDTATSIPGLIAAQNDFNPASDTVANVTLVATTTAVTNTVNANMEQISGSAIVETSAGRIVGNFNVFWDNADALTTKTVNDVGVAGSGLTQQNVRDALKLAPTAGSPGSGSTDEDLDTLLSRTAAGVTTTVTAPFNTTDNTITINAGDTYNIASGQRITVTSDEWPDLTSAVATNAVTMRSKDRRHTVQVDVVIVTAASSGDQTIAIDLTAVQTGGMVIGTETYIYDVNPALSSGEVVTLVKGKVTVNDNP